jgi:hypothetical protein
VLEQNLEEARLFSGKPGFRREHRKNNLAGGSCRGMLELDDRAGIFPGPVCFPAVRPRSNTP